MLCCWLYFPILCVRRWQSFCGSHQCTVNRMIFGHATHSPSWLLLLLELEWHLSADYFLAQAGEFGYYNCEPAFLRPCIAGRASSVPPTWLITSHLCHRACVSSLSSRPNSADDSIPPLLVLYSSDWWLAHRCRERSACFAVCLQFLVSALLHLNW